MTRRSLMRGERVTVAGVLDGAHLATRRVRAVCVIALSASVLRLENAP